MSRSSVEAGPDKLKDMLERSLDVLERSQAILERSLAMESALSRLVEGQEELRRMIMAMVNESDVPEMTPASTTDLPERDPVGRVKKEEEDVREIERIHHPARILVSPVIGRDEEDDDISSVSSVSTDEDIDYMDLGGEEKNPPGRPTRGDLPVTHSVTRSLSSGQEGAQESDEEDDGASSMSSEHEASISGEETDLDDEDTGREGSGDASAPNRYNSELLAVWKCAVCGKLIRGPWHCRQQHIESHEELKLSCPVPGCSARISSHHFVRHLRLVHKTTRSSLPVEQQAELQRQKDEINQKTMYCEMKYFPPSSLVSFAETRIQEAHTRTAVNPACKKCGKIYAALPYRRNHVGNHLNMTIQCPLRCCKSSGTVHTITGHLWSKHKKALSKLTKQERDRFEEARRKFYEEVDTVMEEYFSEVLQREEKCPICRKCGKDVLKPSLRRNHVGAHLKAKIPCPFHDCRYSGNLGLLNHLHNKHGKNLQTLTEEQRGRFEESRRKFHVQVDAVMDEYFS